MRTSTLRRSLVALFVAATSIGAVTQAQAETLRIGYQKYGTLVLLKAKGTLEKRLAEQGYVHRVVNASVSGETSAGGASRLPALLAEHRPSHVLIELGGNDGLRGQSLEQLQQNLAGMVEKSQAAGAKVLLLGMQLPPNYGPRYTQAFAAVYPALGERYRVPVLPFLLEGVGGQAELMQADGIHPRSSAQPRLLENVWPLLQPLL